MRFEPVTNNKWFNEIGIPQLGLYTNEGELIITTSTRQKCNEIIMAFFTNEVINFDKFEALNKEIESSDLFETFDELFEYICKNAKPHDDLLFDVYKNIMITLPLGNIVIISKKLLLRFFSYERAIIELEKIVNNGDITSIEASALFCKISTFDLFRTYAEFIAWFNKADKSLQLQLEKIGVVISQDTPSN